MAFIPAPNVTLIELRYLWFDQQCANTLYVEGSAPQDAVEMILFSGTIINWWRAFIAPLVSESVTLKSIYMRDLTTESSTSVEVPVSAPNTGTVTASSSLPNSNTWTVSFRTQLAGRSYRGRNYVLGLTEAHVSGNTVNFAVCENYVAAYNQLKTEITDANLTWVIVSRYHNKLPRATAVTTPVLTVTYEDQVIDGQRRRLPGRGK